MTAPTTVSREAADAHAYAEAKKAEAEAQAALIRAKSEAAKNHAEARKATAEAEIQEHLAVEKKIAADAARHKEKADLAKDEHHHVYVFKGGVDSASVGNCTAQLRTWMRSEPGCDIEIVFNSPGGSVIDGMALFDYIQQVRSAGHHVTTSTIGMAASMGGILLQAGDKRVMGRESYILIHEVSFGAGGKIGEVEDEVAFVKKIQTRVIKIFASRSKLTERQVKAGWNRKDWWIDSDEALKLGLVDEVR